MKNLFCSFCFLFFTALMVKEAYAQKLRFFTPVDLNLQQPIDKGERYVQYEGKHIRAIHIKVLEPFGSSLDDTTFSKINWAGKTANFLHIPTRDFIIRDLLRINDGEAFDALLVRETERLIRQSGFIKDTRTIIKVVDDNQVDIIFVVEDLWSINGDIISLWNPSSVRIYEHNFLGLAHSIENKFTYDFRNGGRLGMFGSYSIPFILNTYTSLTAFYSTAGISSLRGLTLNRGFFSPLTEWAGGISVTGKITLYGPSGETIDADTVSGNNGIIGYSTKGINIIQSKSNEQDYWYGRSFKIGNGTSARARSTRFVTAARISNINYSIRNQNWSDTVAKNQNSAFVLGSIGVFRRQYYIDRDIYRFGINEDVPVGFSVALTGGYEFKKINPSPYFKISGAYGDHFDGIGNISGAINIGSYTREGIFEEGAITYNGSYFSDIFGLGRWGFRQFANTSGYYGINRLPSDFANLSGLQEFFGFQSPNISGTKKTTINFQSVFYAPVAFLGFRFAPVAMFGLGMLSNKNEKLFQGKVHQWYGIGLLVRNESLAFTTFRFSIAFYPTLPGFDGFNYRLNPTGAYDLKFQDFTVGRPETSIVR